MFSPECDDLGLSFLAHPLSPQATLLSFWSASIVTLNEVKGLLLQPEDSSPEANSEWQWGKEILRPFGTQNDTRIVTLNEVKGLL